MNKEKESEKRPPDDLEERLLDYAARIISLTDKLEQSTSSRYISGQLLRSGTSPLADHGEGQAAESAADFIHESKHCLEELRESKRWLRLIERVPLSQDLTEVTQLIQETDELKRIFNASILTAQKRR